MKTTLLILVGALLTGCVPSTFWCQESYPLTEPERRAVAEHEAKLLESVPSSFVRDFSSAVAAVHKTAMETCCVPRLFEYRLSEFGDAKPTGRWRLMQEVGAPSATNFVMLGTNIFRMTWTNTVTQ